MKTYEDKVAQLNQRRVEALHAGDIGRYASLCEQLGIKPEFPDLIETYDAGKLKVDFERPRDKREPVVRKQPDRLEVFLDEAKNLRNTGTFSDNSKSKRTMLIKHFPNRFGRDGNQDLHARGYNPAQIGRIFQRVYDVGRGKA
tara:strand:+ start:285 stop:713 length:429 start_codon:yes stop_codon:yes gene_type:complete